MSPPNVLLICVDQWPGNTMDCAGHPAIRTPTLDQFAINGTRFRNAYSECPVCVPARRTLMTGLAPHSHGMLQNCSAPMPETPTLAETFRDAGYQTSAVGKMHWSPQRQRCGFEELLLDEEGRGGEGCRADDYELFLGDKGFPGQRFAGGMNNNNYLWRPWHLPEDCHVTNWTAQQMARLILRRDPTRPCFWYCSFSHPHPPLAPLHAYLDLYRDIEVPEPYIGNWIAGDVDQLPPALQREVQHRLDRTMGFDLREIARIRRAYYALCTHIDHQIRVVIGTLREEHLLHNTILCFTADHGEMLGNHRIWAKHWMVEDSNNIPMILVGTREQQANGRVRHHHVENRLVALRDIMPTLLELADIPVPRQCEGLSMVGEAQRPYLVGGKGDPEDRHNPTRMIRDDHYKLIYFPVGNLSLLFNMDNDRQELHNLANEPNHASSRDRLTRTLIETLPENERQLWAPDGNALTGWPDAAAQAPAPENWYSGQHGLQWPSR